MERGIMLLHVRQQWSVKQRPRLMAGPAKQFDRDEALKRAVTLFWAKGFEATSMQDLVLAMGVNRASLYDTFGNKQAIYAQALDSYCTSMASGMGQMAQDTGSALESLRQFLTHLVSEDKGLGPNGCFANNAAVELGPHDPEIAGKVRLFWQHIENGLKAVLDKAVEQGELRPAADTRGLARFINTTLQGLAVKSKAGTDPEETRATVEFLLQALSV